MSLPAISFTNNLGTITFNQALIGVTDTWEWDGRVARHARSVSVDGHMKPTESFTGLATDRGADGKRYGERGSLTLPYTTLTNIKLVSLDLPTGVWIDWEPVQAVFADEFPDGNRYTLSFFGITIYNPRLSIPIPMRQLRDDYPLMPMKFGQPFKPNEPRAGVFRTRVPQRNMDVMLSGSVRMDDNVIPPGMLETLNQRQNVGTSASSDFRIPTGYPRPFNLGDAIPELTQDMNLAHVMVTDAQLVWHVEDGMAQVSIKMICPPQVVGG